VFGQGSVPGLPALAADQAPEWLEVRRSRWEKQALLGFNGRALPSPTLIRVVR
jgi:hypothetical protein